MLQRVFFRFLRGISPVSDCTAMHRIGQRRALLVRQPLIPHLAQFGFAQVIILMLAPVIADGVLALRIGDAFLRRPRARFRCAGGSSYQ